MSSMLAQVSQIAQMKLLHLKDLLFPSLCVFQNILQLISFLIDSFSPNTYCLKPYLK